MIQIGTFVNIIDNSGAKKGLCIHILNSGYKQRYALIGDIILISVKIIKFSKNNRVKKGEIHKAIVVQTKRSQLNVNCNYTKFFQNSVVLLNKQNKPLGTRIFGCLPKIFKHNKFLKLTSLSSGLIQ